MVECPSCNKTFRSYRDLGVHVAGQHKKELQDKTQFQKRFKKYTQEPEFIKELKGFW